MSAPLTLADRVAETAVNVTNVSPMPLGGAVDARHDSFVGALGVTGGLVPYVIVHRTSGQWEYGYGVLATGPDTITRAVVKRNSAHTTSLINFSAGTVDVFLDIGAEDLPVLDADDRGIGFIDYNAAPSFEHTLFGARGTKAAPTAIQSGDTLGRYGFGGYGATAFSNRAKAAMRGSAAENWTDAAQGADLVWATTPKTTTTATDRMWLSSEGALAIGAIYGSGGASQPLQVHATVGPLWLMRSSNNTAGSNLSIVKSRGATAGSLAALVAGDAISILNFLGVAGDGSTVASAAQISVDIPASGVATTTIAGQITFLTTNLAGSQAIRLKLSSEGVVTPGADNSYALGTGALRWSDFQSMTGTFGGALAAQTSFSVGTTSVLTGVVSIGSAAGQYGSTAQSEINALSLAIAQWSRSGNDTTGVVLNTVKSRGASIGSSVKVQAGDTLFTITMRGVADDNSTVSQAASYRSVVPTGGVPGSATTVSADHVWATRNIAGVFADRLWLTSEGVLKPGVDNTYALGTASLRWSDFQAVTGTFGGTTTFSATAAINLSFAGNADIKLSNASGVLRVVDSGFTTALMTLSQAGAISFSAPAGNAMALSLVAPSGFAPSVTLNQSGQVSWLIENHATTGVFGIGESGSTWFTLTKTTGAGAFTGALAVSGITTVSAGVVIGVGTFAAGKIYTEATGGLTVIGKAGSTYDFILYNPAGTYAGGILSVATGTGNVGIPNGTLGIGAAPVAQRGLTVAGSYVGVAGSVEGIRAAGTLTGGANNDLITAFRAVPTYAAGGFTGTLAAAFYADTVSGGATNFSFWHANFKVTEGGALTVASSIRVGTNPNGGAMIGLPNNQSLGSRNAANNADIDMIYLNASNVITIGQASIAVKMPNYGAGAATFDASGNITSVSDERHKADVLPFTRGLKDLRGIVPITHRYNVESGLDTFYRYPGFGARNVREFMPEVVFERHGDGIMSLYDRGILAALVNAVKELDVRTASLN